MAISRVAGYNGLAFPIVLTADEIVLLNVGGALKIAGNFTTVYAKGTWGSGTLTFYATPDGTDTNKFALGLTMVADGFISLSQMDNIKTHGIVAILTGSTAPSISVWAL